MGTASRRASWTVTLVCGASGVGKSSVAIPLAARYGTPLGEADDIATAVRAMTTYEGQPTLHYWHTHRDMVVWTPQRLAQLQIQAAEALRPAFEAVIADHVDGGAPVVLEGDHLLPDLGVGFGPTVRAVVLHEPDVDQLARNYRLREPDGGDQRGRAEASALVAVHLAERARRSGVPVVPARPWDDAVERVDHALRAHPPAQVTHAHSVEAV